MVINIILCFFLAYWFVIKTTIDSKKNYLLRDRNEYFPIVQLIQRKTMKIFFEIPYFHFCKEICFNSMKVSIIYQRLL